MSCVGADANIMFDFESTTQEYLNPNVTIINYRKKVSYMRDGVAILRIINKIIKDCDLDAVESAKHYQKNAPTKLTQCAGKTTRMVKFMRSIVLSVLNASWMIYVKHMESRDLLTARKQNTSTRLL